MLGHVARSVGGALPGALSAIRTTDLVPISETSFLTAGTFTVTPPTGALYYEVFLVGPGGNYSAPNGGGGGAGVDGAFLFGGQSLSVSPGAIGSSTTFSIDGQVVMSADRAVGQTGGTVAASIGRNRYVGGDGGLGVGAIGQDGGGLGGPGGNSFNDVGGGGGGGGGRLGGAGAPSRSNDLVVASRGGGAGQGKGAAPGAALFRWYGAA